MYDEPFKVRIDNTVVNIASRELKKRTVHQELNECVKRFVDLKHFLETCALLLKRVNRDPLVDSLKKYVDAQMGFGKRQTKETESAFMNDLMDLEWLVQRRITHSVKYEKLTTKRRGISKEEYEQQEKTRLKHAAGRRQLGANY